MDRTPTVRASAADRDRAIEALAEHMAAQRLTKAEFENRLGVAHAAVGQAELGALFTDLPRPHPRLDGATPSPPTPGPVSGKGLQRRPAAKAAAVAYGLFPVAGGLAFALAWLTGFWLWLLIVPPLAYGVREVARHRA